MIDGFGRSTRHGTTTMYHRGCRCDECRAAQSDAGKRFRERKAEWPVATPHGTRNGYCNYGCRCDDCKAAQSEYKRIEYREKLAFRETLARLREGGAS